MFGLLAIVVVLLCVKSHDDLKETRRDLARKQTKLDELREALVNRIWVLEQEVREQRKLV